MNLLKNYRPDGLEVEITSGNTVTVMVVRNNPRIGIVARVKGQDRVILWGKEDIAAHLGDTEEEFITQLKVVI